MTMDIKAVIARALEAMTQEQAMGVYNALGQWAENTAVGLEESVNPGEEESDPDIARDFASLRAVRLVVDACEAEMAASVA